MDKKQVSLHSLDARFKNLIKLSEKLEKIPRKFGTDGNLSSTEIHTIELVGENEGLSVTDIAKLQGVTKGAVSQTLKRLEYKGLTVKEEDPANNSRSIIGLTNKGKTAFYAHKHWHETMDGGFKEYFYTLEQDKIDFLDQFLTRIENFLKQRILTEK
jgi:DNA-binding MarR family transcriptional regulator